MTTPRDDLQLQALFQNILGPGVQVRNPERAREFLDEKRFQFRQQNALRQLAAAEARIADPQEQQPTFTTRPDAPGPLGLAGIALQGIGELGGGQAASILGLAPQEFDVALAREREVIASQNATNPVSRILQQIESDIFAPATALRQTRGDFPQIPVNLPGEGADFSLGTAELLTGVFDPLNFAGPGAIALKGTGAAAARGVQAAAIRAAPVAREAAEAAGRRATQAAGRILPERRVFAAGVEDVGRAADEALEAEIAVARQARLTPEQRLEAEVAAVRKTTVETVQKAEVPEAVPARAAETAHIEQGAPDIGGPPKRTRGPGEPPDIDPSEPLRLAREQKLPNESIDERLLVRHQAAINVAQLESRRAVDAGNVLLRNADWGVRRGRTRAPKDIGDINSADRFREALHGEGDVPLGMEESFELARQQTDFESAARIDFDPEMATVENYFDRGWKPPEEIARAQTDSRGKLVLPPGFRLPRVGATYKEMRELGFEPLFWNAFEQINYSRLRGVRYRQQMELVAALKDLGDEVIRPWAGGDSNLPKGWRVPKVGPAFEGKPFAGTDAATGETQVMFTRKFIVPEKFANRLENMYGARPNLGSVHVGGRDFEILKAVDAVTFTPKRIRLMGSFFQDIDFLTRSGIGSFTKMVDDLMRGRPVEAVRSLSMFPVTVVDVLNARVNPARRRSLVDAALNDTTELIEGRSGVTMRKIMEAGLNLRDRTILPNNLDEIVSEAAQTAGVLGIRSVGRAVRDFEGAFRNSLFQGTYPAAIQSDVKNNIVHVMARTYRDLTDTQLVARVAEQANIKYSTIPETMSVIQNRFIRESMLRLFFSIGESEGLLRQATRTMKGPNKSFWIKHWIGAYLFLMSTANIVHFVTTGEALPKERYSPISKDKWGPLPFGYNTQFAAPDLPGVARSALSATIDLVGQMDTAFRVLNPTSFTESRFSVPVRAIVNQWSGTDFFGQPNDQIGPGGVISRTIGLALDLFSPIGIGGLAQSFARQNIPGAEGVIPLGESRLGTTGLAIQATGLNLRSRTIPQLKAILEQGEVTPDEAQNIRTELEIRRQESRIKRGQELAPATIGGIGTR